MKKEKIFIYLVALAVLSMSWPASGSREAETKAAVTPVASKPCASCPPAGSVGSQLKLARKQLGQPSRPGPRRKQEEMARTADELERIFAKLDEAAGEIPAETYDPQAIVDKVGPDAEPLFLWVRDNTFLIPYRGTLRGPVGVLMERRGNSLDRALLLLDLLAKAGHDAQLAHGTLTRERALEILDKAVPPPQEFFYPRLRPLPQSDKEALKGYAAEFGLDEKALAKVIEDEQGKRAGLARKISDRDKELVPKLLAAVEKYRKQDTEGEKNTLVEGVRDHWWVQYKGETGTVDLDPTLRDSPPGKSLTARTETKQVDDLPRSLHHSVIIRDMIERWKGGRLEKQEVLRYEFRPAELLGRRIVLAHATAGADGAKDVLGQKEPKKRLRDMILAQKEWTPVLKVGEEEVAKAGFDEAGKLLTKAAGKKETRSPLGGLAGAFGGGGTTAPAAGGEQQDTVLTAEWVEYEIHSPGLPARKIRRDIFDLIGPAARETAEVPRPRFDSASKMKRNLALLGRTEILPLFCQLSEDYVRHLADERLLAERETLLSFYVENTLNEPEEVLDKLGELDRLPAPLYRLAIARPDPENYIASPNIVSLHYLLREDGQGRLDRAMSLDIVDNRIAVAASKAGEAFRVRLAQGVRDSVRESVYATGQDGEDSLTRLYRESEKRKIGWLIPTGPGDGLLLESKLPGDLIVRLKQAMAEGHVVIVPREPVMIDGWPVIQWWKVNPKTGDTLILGEQGWGQAMTSYVQQVERIVQIKGWIELAADILRCLETGVIAAFGHNPEVGGNEFATCIQVILCNQLYNQFEDYCDLETNWTNFIIKQIAGYLAGEFCDALMSDDEGGLI